MVDNRFFINNGPFTLGQIAEICDAKLLDQDKSEEKVTGMATMESANAEDVCFFFDKKAKEKASHIKAKACITTEMFKEFVPDTVIKLIAVNPKFSAQKLNEVFYGLKPYKKQIAKTAVIAENAKIGKDCTIGEGAVIGDDVTIGDNCIIEANAVIDEGCEIGNNCRIGVGAHLSYTIMGNDCYVYSGARLGQDGFGFNVVNGQHKRIPQLGKLVVGNDVEVGANSCIDRGAMDDTIIGDGCRIDNLVQIAHNCVLGRGCIIVAQVGIAGSTKLGDYVVCGGQVGIADHIIVGSGVQIGAQSGVMSNIEPGQVVMGTPTVPHKQFMRQASFLQSSVKKG